MNACVLHRGLNRSQELIVVLGFEFGNLEEEAPELKGDGRRHIRS